MNENYNYLIDYNENENFNEFVNKEISKILNIDNFRFNKKYNKECDYLIFNNFYIIFYSYNNSFNQYVFVKYIIPNEMKYKINYKLNYNNSFEHFQPGIFCEFMKTCEYYSFLNLRIVRKIVENFTDNDKEYMKIMNIIMFDNFYEYDLVNGEINKVEEINDEYSKFIIEDEIGYLIIDNYIPNFANNTKITYEIILLNEYNKSIELDGYHKFLLLNYFFNNEYIKNLIDNKIIVKNNNLDIFSIDVLNINEIDNIQFSTFEKINIHYIFPNLLNFCIRYYSNIYKNINYLIQNIINNLYNNSIQDIFKLNIYKDSGKIIYIRNLTEIFYELKYQRLLDFIHLKFEKNIVNNLNIFRNNKIVIIEDLKDNNNNFTIYNISKLVKLFLSNNYKINRNMLESVIEKIPQKEIKYFFKL